MEWGKSGVPTEEYPNQFLPLAPHQLNVTTSDGKTVSGSCSSTNADGLSLTANQRTVKNRALHFDADPDVSARQSPSGGLGK
jgi:hypothetical protein